jgi:methionyl-tRNA formyltransferase
MDQGPVDAFNDDILSKTETKPELYHALADIGTNLLLETLPQILEGSLSPLPQNERLATYTPRLTKEDAWLNPAEVTATEAESTVRAHLDFPKTKITINGHVVIITKAAISEYKHSDMDITCKDETYLSIKELIAPSGRRMSAADFERGYLRS